MNDALQNNVSFISGFFDMLYSLGFEWWISILWLVRNLIIGVRNSRSNLAGITSEWALLIKVRSLIFGAFSSLFHVYGYGSWSPNTSVKTSPDSYSLFRFQKLRGFTSVRVPPKLRWKKCFCQFQGPSLECWLNYNQTALSIECSHL